ncbi:MAG TPA: LysR family transcriptional regulator [Steroidobacteraceae bacterium]|nr:LysR family transcriptional regulator [Steroidobacteraceae bacterium]
MNLARADLNLLVLFEAVYEELHVGRAASRMHISASAVSHGLGRLRRLMQDPLFLRHPKGVVPTDRARQLAAPVGEVLERARQVMAQAEVFDPAKSRRRFLIGAPDAAAAVMLPLLLSRLRRKAPGIDLGVVNWVGRFEDALTELDGRKIDVALLPLPEVPARFVSRTLFEEDFVLVARPGHPLAKKCTLEGYAASSHMLVSVSGDPEGMVDKLLAKKKLKRHVALTVPNFLLALALIEESDLVAALPRHFVAKHAPRYKVVSFEPPMPLMSSPIVAIAPQVATRDGGLLWLLDSLEAAGKAARELLRRR